MTGVCDGCGCVRCYCDERAAEEERPRPSPWRPGPPTAPGWYWLAGRSFAGPARVYSVIGGLVLVHGPFLNQLDTIASEISHHAPMQGPPEGP